MDNPAGCPRAQAQAVGCPQAPQGPTTTQTKKQQRPGVAINYHAQSTDHQRRLTNRRHQPSIYTAKRATQRSPRSVTIPEIAGHVRRNAQLLSGCVGPLVEHVRIDPASAAVLNSRVVVLTDEQSKAGKFTVLGPITATSCMNKIWEPAPTNEDATNQLRVKDSY